MRGATKSEYLVRAVDSLAVALANEATRPAPAEDRTLLPGRLGSIAAIFQTACANARGALPHFPATARRWHCVFRESDGR